MDNPPDYYLTIIQIFVWYHLARITWCPPARATGNLNGTKIHPTGWRGRAELQAAANDSGSDSDDAMMMRNDDLSLSAVTQISDAVRPVLARRPEKLRTAGTRASDQGCQAELLDSAKVFFSAMTRISY